MENILQLIKENKLSEARKSLIEMNAADIAYYLEELDAEMALTVFRILPKDLSVDTFSHISGDKQRHIGESITEKELSNILDNLYLDDTVDYLEELPANMVKKILRNTEKNRRNLINQFLNYPENSAGSIMTIEFVDLKKEMTIKEAIEHIRKTGIDKETIDICYVTDEKRKLEGVLSIRGLLLSEEDQLIKDVMNPNIIYGYTTEDQEDIASIFKKYDFTSLPVVDKENRLVGIITIDDVVDIIEMENTEDFHKMAAMQPSEESYLKTSALKLAKNRIVWLLILMVSATFTGRILRKYEDVLQAYIILNSFIPMLMDTGGNSGSQSSTLIIRSLALGEVSPLDIFKIMRKELQVGIIVGVALAGANFLRLYYFEGMSVSVSLTVSLTLIFIVVMSKLVGGMLPMLAKAFKMDPAIMAGPLITTIVDACALIVYFKIAQVLLGI